MKEYHISIEGKRRVMEFTRNGKKYKVYIPKECPPEFIEQIYKMKVREIGEKRGVDDLLSAQDAEPK